MLKNPESCVRKSFIYVTQGLRIRPLRSGLSNQAWPVRRRFANCRYYSESRFKKDDLKYNNHDEDMRMKILDSAIGAHSNAYSKTTLDRRLPFRTILLIIACTSSITMVAYSGVQLYQCQKHRVKKSFLLPLWFHPHIYTKKVYSFPKDLKYLDPECYRYFVAQLSREETVNGSFTVDSIPKILEEENIKYKILEELSRNTNIRQMFKVPFDFALFTENFKIWIDPKHPTVSGIKIDIDSTRDTTSLRASWSIRSVNMNTILNDFAITAGVKLDKLEAAQPTKTTDKASEATSIASPKDYDIRFAGQVRLLNNADSYLGTIKYKGCIDFNHILLNRGIKVSEVDMLVNRNESGTIKYKIV
ncbi:Piso0_002440 [Millerozyma farinosa CBS 7064]|uniref:Piso0_002440 protein n=1 Tax=Pichia sorbitophila (strain ATCC MYA-4447 / BCRC 22081 / CBS 7064 / NBRC 10061 / NRRL Y-12695) TaxID=559304 RepID=G8YCL8_PICSO|nr:Piso0_002440 [Millerozyma farinosa CBS 7064]